MRPTRRAGQTAVVVDAPSKGADQLSDQEAMATGKAPPLAKINSISQAMDGVVNSTQPVTVSARVAERPGRRDRSSLA